MSETVTRVFGIIPHRAGWLQRRIQQLQRSLSFPEPWASVTHVGVEHGGIGVEMVLRADSSASLLRRIIGGGNLCDVEEKYGRDNVVLYSVFAGGQPPHLFSSAVRCMYPAPYARLQLVGLMLRYILEWPGYDRLPEWIRQHFKVCCEGAARAYGMCGVELPFAPDDCLPAQFFMPPFRVVARGGIEPEK